MEYRMVNWEIKFGCQPKGDLCHRQAPLVARLQKATDQPTDGGM
jgi:hypothetical protein